RIVFESPVQSGFLALRALTADRDRSIKIQKVQKTEPNRSRPVKCGFFAVYEPVLTSYG
ncbi:hypothetical protein GALMADRAFT_55571, partial [Galerina marginata CBS 339.88]